MKNNRWLVYILFGLTFGVIDFYYQVLVQKITSDILLASLVLVIWLVVALPVAIYEAKVTGSAWRAALASAVTWVVAVISYYLFWIIKLVFISEPSRPEMHITNRGDPYFSVNIKNFLQYDVLGGIGEWILVAIIGGIVVGYLTGFIFLKTRSLKLNAE